ncbi:MAG: hypothetical protein KKA07_17590 [Bacteroidetes bacterium]|nr:hypothetical protein [Bacteroidota bacterium]
MNTYIINIGIFLITAFGSLMISDTQAQTLSISHFPDLATQPLTIHINNQSDKAIRAIIRVEIHTLTPGQQHTASLTSRETELLPGITVFNPADPTYLHATEGDDTLVQLLAASPGALPRVYVCASVSEAPADLCLQRYCYEYHPATEAERKQKKPDYHGQSTLDVAAYKTTPFGYQGSNYPVMVSTEQNLAPAGVPLSLVMNVNNSATRAGGWQFVPQFSYSRFSFEETLKAKSDAILAAENSLRDQQQGNYARKTNELSRIRTLMAYRDSILPDSTGATAIINPETFDALTQREKEIAAQLSTADTPDFHQTLPIETPAAVRQNLKQHKLWSRKDNLMAMVHRAQLGNLTIYESELTVFGAGQFGAMLSLEPGRFHISSAVGLSNHKPVSISDYSILQPKTMQYVVGGVGTISGNHLQLGYFSFLGKTLPDSLLLFTKGFSDNRLIFTQLQLTSARKKLTWINEFSGSVTGISMPPENQPASISENQYIQAIVSQNNPDTSHYTGYAFQSKLQANLLRNKLPVSLQLTSTSENYFTGGNPFLIAGASILRARTSKYFFRKKLRLTGHCRYVAPNGDNNLSKTLSYGVEISTRIKNLPEMNFGIIPSTLRTTTREYLSNMLQFSLNRQFRIKKVICFVSAGSNVHTISAPAQNTINTWVRGSITDRRSRTISFQSQFIRNPMESIIADCSLSRIDYTIGWKKLHFNPGLLLLNQAGKNSFLAAFKLSTGSNTRVGMAIEGMKRLSKDEIDSAFISDMAHVIISYRW